MKARAAKTRFLQRLAEAGGSIDALRPVAGIEAMFAYYAEERADGCEFDADGDMVLFQWGTYDWGKGAAFEIDITRQLIVAGDEEEEPRQLSLTFRFDPSVGGEAGEGHRWCHSPDELPEFRQFVSASSALTAASHHSPKSIELRYGRT